jgi:site-specific DNA-cytosine methylase
MRIAVLFDGAGLARLGLETAGHDCTGVELNPVAHWLGQFVGSGNCVLGDVRDFDLSGYDAVWASPPCQARSTARTQGCAVGDYAEDLLEWSLELDVPILMVENIKSQRHDNNAWGTIFNAAQFEAEPRQNRQRVVGGRYPLPGVHRAFKAHYHDIDLCPCITASEYKGCATDKRRASRYYGRRLTVEECAFHMGFNIPDSWRKPPSWWTDSFAKWTYEIYRAIGNGVPVYMAKAFGDALAAVENGQDLPWHGRGNNLVATLSEETSA